MIFTFQSIFTALLLGFTPALLWLKFWLQEDRLHPEPRNAIALTFFTGMCIVLMVIPVQKLVATFPISQLFVITCWAYIEECAKYAGAYIAILTKKVVDEPLDPLIYMITIALGFAALENTLFLLNPLSGTHIAEIALTSNFRFFGATLLHVVCSSVIGLGLALSFHIHGTRRSEYMVVAVILSGGLHALFNVFILSAGKENILLTFSAVWILAILLFLAFEYIKRLPTNQLKNS